MNKDVHLISFNYDEAPPRDRPFVGILKEEDDKYEGLSSFEYIPSLGGFWHYKTELDPKYEDTFDNVKHIGYYSFKEDDFLVWFTLPILKDEE